MNGCDLIRHPCRQIASVVGAREHSTLRPTTWCSGPHRFTTRYTWCFRQMIITSGKFKENEMASSLTLKKEAPFKFCSCGIEIAISMQAIPSLLMSANVSSPKQIRLEATMNVTQVRTRMTARGLICCWQRRR